MNVKAAHRALLDAAREQRTVGYGEIIRLAELRSSGDALRGELGRLLGEIVESEIAQDPAAPMLSAEAMPADGNRPSKGFFDLARELRRLDSTRETDEDTFWIAELNRVYAYYSKD